MNFDRQPSLVGDLVIARPLRKSDFETLYAVASDREIWFQHPANNRYERPVFEKLFQESLESGGALLVSDARSGKVIGSSRYHGYDETASQIEIGWTFLARSHWGGRYNGELKRLMLQHAFQFVSSVVFLVGPENVRSQKAVERIGGRRDGERVDGSGFKSLLYRITASGFFKRCHDELSQHAERLERSVWRAVIAKDGAALESLFADDYIEVTLSGKRAFKDQVVEQSPKSDEIRSYELDRVEVISLSDGTLLISYHLIIDGTYLDETILPRQRWATSIWRNRHGSWKCCFFQQSPYADNQPGNLPTRRKASDDAG